MSSIPLLFPHPFLAVIADWFEAEHYSTHAHHILDTRALLRVVSRAAERWHVVALGGDLHMHADQTICPSHGACFRSIISSGITRGSAGIHAPHLMLYHAFAFSLLPSMLPALGDEPGWSAATTSVALINNYALLTEASDGAVAASYFLRVATPGQAALLATFRWIAHVSTLIVAWGVALVVAACWRRCKRAKRAKRD